MIDGENRKILFSSVKISKKPVFAVLLFLLVSLMALGATGESLPSYDDDFKAPTCTENGYRAIEEQGVIRIEEIPATGHQFSKWTTDSEGKARTHVCLKCGFEETIRINSIPEENLPRLEMNGLLDGIGRKSKVPLEVKFTGQEQSFQCYGLLTLQGHSTYGYPKKNYTIRFYNDTEGQNKHKVVFKNWNREHKYILKANYIDTSQSRNIASARIWTDIVKNRKTIPERISTLPTYGAVDGFPLAVYLNGDFLGLYSLNLHKDDDLYQMKDGEEAVLICNEEKTGESLFRAKAAFLPNNESDWEIEYCGTEDDTWARDSFNDFITFVMESDDVTFREHMKDYLDTEAAIDYLLFIYALGLENSGAKDMVMLSFGDRWIPSAYDMDEAFGLDAQKLVYRNPEAFLPSFFDTTWDSSTGSLLWDRILNCFTEQLKARYSELREGPLSNENLLESVRDYIVQIPESFYDYDWYLYPGRPEQLRDMNQQIEQYIPERMRILDSLFKGA